MTPGRTRLLTGAGLARLPNEAAVERYSNQRRQQHLRPPHKHSVSSRETGSPSAALTPAADLPAQQKHG